MGSKVGNGYGHVKKSLAYLPANGNVSTILRFLCRKSFWVLVSTLPYGIQM